MYTCYNSYIYYHKFCASNEKADYIWLMKQVFPQQKLNNLAINRQPVNNIIVITLYANTAGERG